MTELSQSGLVPRPPDEERLTAARRRAAELQGFYIHLVVYLVINAGLFAINALSRGSGGTWWFYWPLMGWGLGLAVHAATVSFGVFSEDWKERKAHELLERGGHGHAGA